jgi:hypothetical protein
MYYSGETEERRELEQKNDDEIRKTEAWSMIE